MSAVNGDGEKVDLPREAGYVYSEIEKLWAGEDQQRWKLLGMLQLYEQCQWCERHLGFLMGVHQGTVSRLLKSTRQTLSHLHDLEEVANGREFQQRRNSA